MEEMPYKTTLLNNKIDIGHTGVRIVGLLWLFTAIAFMAVGAGLLTHWEGWVDAALYIAGFSTVLCILGWPHARIGLFLNLAIIIMLGISKKYGWF